MSLETFTAAYLECALWASTDYDGSPIYGDWAPDALKVAQADCKAFYEAAGGDFGGLSDEQAGHDFWLTRNGHGSGFWDRGIGKRGQELTELAQAWGSADLYIGDDGQVYLY